MAACVFCQISKGELPAHQIHREEHALVFLDNRPLFAGHCLVVPTAHHQTLTDLPAGMLGPFFATVQRIASAVQDALGAQGTFVAMNNVVSQSVPHLHVHVVPRTKGDGLKGFFWPRHPYGSPEEMTAVQQKLVNWLKTHG
jgi:histidine triad (HIT) family protein